MIAYLVGTFTGWWIVKVVRASVTAYLDIKEVKRYEYAKNKKDAAEYLAKLFDARKEFLDKEFEAEQARLKELYRSQMTCSECGSKYGSLAHANHCKGHN